MKRTTLVPHVLMAIGIMASTLVAVVTSHSPWLVLGSPVLMTLAMVAATLVSHRLHGDSQGTLRLALSLGAVLVLATGILAFADPTFVAA
jgi:hypothetical protein